MFLHLCVILFGERVGFPPYITSHMSRGSALGGGLHPVEGESASREGWADLPGSAYGGEGWGGILGILSSRWYTSYWSAFLLILNL